MSPRQAQAAALLVDAALAPVLWLVRGITAVRGADLRRVARRRW